jgi:NADPH-dependent 2,4-dienoyl-CoA reductase/sulfur reductase-like enzyme
VRDESVDVVVYGGTPGGLIAAVAAARLGASTLVLEQTRHVGGLSLDLPMPDLCQRRRKAPVFKRRRHAVRSDGI